MTNVLYIGNNLNHKQSNTTSIAILGPLLESEGYTLYYASNLKNKVFRLFDMVFKTIRYASKIDIVVIDTYSTQNFYYAFAVSQICRVLNIEYMPILRGGNLESRLKQSTKWSSMLFNKARVNIAPSLFMKSVFESYGYSNLVYIPNTIAIGNYSFKKRGSTPLKLLWVRSFSKIYNPSLAIRILTALQDEGIAAELCMVGPDTGDGSFQETQQLAETLDVSVTFTGKLPKKDWIALAKDYNIFINTTNFDNMPVSVIEAMALGLPIVSTEVGGIPFLIDHETDGLLVPPDDVWAMANAIKRIINNPVSSQAMAFNARNKVEQFAWEVVKHQWFEVLQ